jgi:hypothetical protein
VGFVAGVLAVVEAAAVEAAVVVVVKGVSM